MPQSERNPRLGSGSSSVMGLGVGDGIQVSVYSFLYTPQRSDTFPKVMLTLYPLILVYQQE